MVPTDYRLDSVVARLIERLEGARPTHTDAEQAERAFREVAARHVEAAITEYRALAPENPDAHEVFLRKEVLETMLPRYVRLAAAMTAAERRGYGFGALAGPVGMPVLAVVAVTVFAVVLRRFLGWWEVWPLVLVDASLPFWPLLAAWLHVRRYRRELEGLVSDMARIQDAERTFLTADELRAARELEPGAKAPNNSVAARSREVERG
jgi:hypothetical protein